MSPAETGGLIVVAVGLVEVVKLLVHKMTPTPKNGASKALLIMQQQVHDLHQAHAIRDGDGVPLWYVPRAWGKVHEEMLFELRTLNNTMATRPCVKGEE